MGDTDDLTLSPSTADPSTFVELGRHSSAAESIAGPSKGRARCPTDPSDRGGSSTGY